MLLFLLLGWSPVQAPSQVGGVVTGRLVHKASGAPAAGEYVGYHQAGEACEDEGYTRTGPDGRFSLTAKPGDWQLSLNPDSELYDLSVSNYPSPKFRMTAGKRIDLGTLKLTLESYQTIAGTVVGDDGKPVPDALVIVRRNPPPWLAEYPMFGGRLETPPAYTSRINLPLRTDASGRFVVKGISKARDADQKLRLRAYDGCRRTGADTILDLRSAHPQVKLVIRPLPFAWITGTVRAPNGQPLRGAVVDFKQVDEFLLRSQPDQVRSPRTDANGRFRLRVWPRDHYVIWAYGPGGLRGQGAPVVPIEGKTHSVPDITLKTGSSHIDLKVLDPDGKERSMIWVSRAAPFNGLDERPMAAEGRFGGLIP